MSIIIKAISGEKRIAVLGIFENEVFLIKKDKKIIIYL